MCHKQSSSEFDKKWLPVLFEGTSFASTFMMLSVAMTDEMRRIWKKMVML
jgi:hypothetical protein